ncbi:hypothetical protein PINS_up010622 [Pythium insidiosum]|nr:hypothetical protein PINS_up010622 [Pythium insidiosum]
MTDDATRLPSAAAEKPRPHDAELEREREQAPPPSTAESTENASTTTTTTTTTAVGVRELLLASSWLEKLAMTVGTAAGAIAGWFSVSLQIVAVDKLLLIARGPATQHADVSRVFHREMELLALFSAGCLLRYLSWSWVATSFSRRHTSTTTTAINQWGQRVQHGVAAMRAFGVAVENGWDLMAVMAVTVVVPLSYMALKNRWNAASSSRMELKKKRLAAHVDQALRHRDALQANAAAHASVFSVTRALDHDQLANEGVGMAMRARIVTSMVLFSTPLIAALWYAVSHSSSEEDASDCGTEGAPLSVCGTGRRLALVFVSVVLLFSSVPMATKSIEDDDQPKGKQPLKDDEEGNAALARKDEIVAWLRVQLQPEARRRLMQHSLSLAVTFASVFTGVIVVAHVIQWILTLTPAAVPTSEIATWIALAVGGLVLAGVALSCSMIDTTFMSVLSRLRLAAIEAALASSSNNAAAPSFASINEDATRVAYQCGALVPVVSVLWSATLTYVVSALVIACIDVKVACLRLLLALVQGISFWRYLVRMNDPVALAVRHPPKHAQWETVLSTYVVPVANAMLFVIESHWVLSGATSPMAPLVAKLVLAALPATFSFSMIGLGGRSAAAGLLAACWRLQQLTTERMQHHQQAPATSGLQPAFARGDVEISMADNAVKIQGGECVAIHCGDNKELVARAFTIGNTGDASVSVSIDGHSIEEYASAWRERRFWRVDGPEPLLLASTWLNNVRLGLDDVSEAEITKAATDAGLTKYVSLQDDVSTELLDGSAALSPAILRSLAVARALLRNPDVLVVVPPEEAATTELDTRSRLPQDTKIVSLLRELLPQHTLLVLTTATLEQPWVEVVDRAVAA